MIALNRILILSVLVQASFSSIIRSTPILSLGGGFELKDSFVGMDFFENFYWETFDDPTHGRVNYVDQRTALARNLTSATSNSFIMKADNTNVVYPSSRGRDSNRIVSRESFTDSILVLDVQHVPWGCSTWPAFWTVTKSNWPSGGEIDVIEGINTDKTNLASLHTSPGCEMAQTRGQTGNTVSTDCNAYDNNNQGCGTSFEKPGSFGPDLNAMGGGWFVMERTQSAGVKIWFWGRNDLNVPLEVKQRESVINPDLLWGLPEASFPSSTTCEFEKHFDAHNIVFDLTFCGDWAGSSFPADSCGPSTCEEFVDNNPGDFKDAYWEINSLQIYVPVISII